VVRIVEVYGGGDGGGAARYMRDVLPGLALMDEVLFLSLGRDQIAPEGTEVHRVRQSQALAAMRRLRPNVLHTHGLRANLLGRIYGRMRGVPVVTTVHSFLAQDYRSAEAAQTALLLDGATLPLSRFLIAVSSAIAQDLLERGALPGSVTVVPNGIAEPPAADLQTLPRIVPGRPLLCIAARLHPAKGIDVALRAMPLLPQAHLAIMGEGPERGALETLARQLGCAERVHFLGYRSDLGSIVAGADLMLIPSRAEGFGLAAVEGMAQGVPVVASRVGALPEVVADGGILFRSEDPTALAQAVHEALARRQGLSTAARAQAERYALDETVRRTRLVLQRAMGDER
jgi:glycosyltransferase involved in cell wall biosynthesis